jgi:hypothetical protein
MTDQELDDRVAKLLDEDVGIVADGGFSVVAHCRPLQLRTRMAQEVLALREENARLKALLGDRVQDSDLALEAVRRERDRVVARLKADAEESRSLWISAHESAPTRWTDVYYHCGAMGALDGAAQRVAVEAERAMEASR